MRLKIINVMGQKQSITRPRLIMPWFLDEYNETSSKCYNRMCFQRKKLFNERDINRNLVTETATYLPENNERERVLGRNADLFKYHVANFYSSIYNIKNRDEKSIDFVEENQFNFTYRTMKIEQKEGKKQKIINKNTFGYKIDNIVSFLSEASINNPGNIPVVVIYPTLLYETREESYQTEIPLPLGMVVNAVFKNKQWLYVQTSHGEEGYILYDACLPLGILPTIQRSHSKRKRPPCWESTEDLYPQPNGYHSDNEKGDLEDSAKPRFQSCTIKNTISSDNYSVCSEKSFDKLYLKTLLNYLQTNEISDDTVNVIKDSTFKSAENHQVKSIIDKSNHTGMHTFRDETSRHILLVVKVNFEGSIFTNTLSVKKGEVVTLIQSCSNENNMDEWFFVRNKDGIEGLIPASVAGYGYI